MRTSISLIFENDNCWYSPQCQLTLCMLGNAYVLSSVFFVVFVFQNIFFQFVFRIPSDDPDQAQYSVGPDLGPDCLQMLSADDPSG